LASSTGEWVGGRPISYVYEWVRCGTSGSNCASIAGETGSRYTVVVADIGQKRKAGA